MNTFTKQEIDIKDNSGKTSTMAKEYCTTQTEAVTKAVGRRASAMAREECFA